MSEPVTSGPWEKVKEHLTLVLSIAGALFIVIRISAISGYSTQTASIVLQEQGTSSAIFGTLLPATPLIPLSVATYLIYDGAALKGDSPRRSWLLAGTLLLTGLMFPWPVLVVAGALVLSVILGTLLVGFLARTIRAGAQNSNKDHRKTSTGLRTKPDESPSHDRVRRLQATLMLVIAAAVVIFSGEPWLPAERLSGTTDLTGYVLKSTDDTIVFLVDSPRRVVRVPAEGVTRSYCSPAPPFSFPWNERLFSHPVVLGLLTSTGEYPRCPDDS